MKARTRKSSARARKKPAPYAHGQEMLFDLCRLLDERLTMLVEEFPATRMSADDFGLRGLLITDAEVKNLLGPSQASAFPGFAPGSLWKKIEPRVAASVRQGIVLPLDVVRERFRLSYFEAECVVVCLAPEAHARYQKLYGYLNDDATQKYPSVDLLLRLLTTPETALEYRSFLVPSAPLLRSGLLTWVEEPANGSPLNRRLKVDAGVLQFLFHDHKLDPELESVWLERDFPAEAETLWVANTDTITAMKPHISGYLEKDAAARERLVISLTGRVGSGRRHAVELACWESGLGLIFLDCSRLIKQPRFEQLITRAFRDSLLHAAPLVLGNFEAVLQDTDRGPEFRIALERQLEERGWIIFLLREESDANNNWFSRHRYVEIKIPELTNEARMNHWKTLLAEHTEFKPEAIDEIAGALASKFRLSAGQIAIAFLRCAHALAGAGKSAKEWSTLLHAQAAQISTPRLGALARKIKPLYHWDQLVLPAKKKELVRDIVRHVQQRRKVMEEWKFESLMSRGKGLTVLFSGPPGTGKTMAAEVIANELQMDLYRIDLAGVVSKYIGETEKNLSRIFREAESSNAILFFDEADALFGKRSEVRDAHDRYANIEISYLLQQIENLEGVVMLATNMRQHLDEAFLRRMQVVVEFPLPAGEDRLRIWRQSFPLEAPVSKDVDFDFLARQFELTGGHISNVALWAALLASEEDSKIRMRHCVRATHRELEKIGRRCLKEEFGSYAGLLELEGQPESATAHPS